MIKKKKTIIFLGGSHTWGVAMEQEKRYTDLLKKNNSFNILNMGHCSLGLDQISVAIKNKAQKFKPDMIVIEQYPWSIHRILNTYVNGFCRPTYKINKKNKVSFSAVPKIAFLKIFRTILGGYYEFKKEFLEYKNNLNVKYNYDPKTDPIFLLWKTRYYDYMYKLAEGLVKEIQDYCLMRNIKLVFLIGTVNQQLKFCSDTALIDYDLPRKRFINILKKQNIEYVDTLKKMLLENKKSSPVAYEDGHINEKGNFIFYKEIKRYLKTMNWS